MFRKALNLAKSARERESDTGAMMLTILFNSVQGGARDKFLSDLISISSKQAEDMKCDLMKLTDESLAIDGHTLPLVHGLVQALKLCLEQGPAIFDNELIARRCVHAILHKNNSS